MAEFFDVMVEMHRMHNAYDDCDDGCPLHDKGFCNKSYYKIDEEDIKEAEKIIMKWSKEHPVVYPTWGEWFLTTCQVPLTSDLRHNNWEKLLASHIPAEIAEKLRIEPKGR